MPSHSILLDANPHDNTYHENTTKHTIHMKWQSLAILMLLCGCGNAYVTLNSVEGGGKNIIFPRNPFYGSQIGAYCQVAVRIQTPTYNATFWDNTQEIRVNVTGGTGMETCEYMFNGHPYNSLKCSSAQNVTFTREPIYLTVRVRDNGCESTNTTVFTVLDYRASGWSPNIGLVGGVALAMGVMVEDHRRRRGRRRL